MASLTVTPVRFHPSVERAEVDEAKTGASINEAMQGINDKTAADYGHAVRSVHAKSHALVEAEIAVLGGLPSELAQGLFAAPATYPMIMRFSTNPGDILPDSVSTPRGLALKIIGVSGERLSGSESDTTQDFVMANGPTFIAPSGAKFLGSLKLLAATTDRGESLKVALSAALRGAETLLEAAGTESAQIKGLGGQPQTHQLGETYWGQAPFLYGDNIAKFQVVPVSSELTALTGKIVDVSGKPDGLREALVDHFLRAGGTWELRVQLCMDLATMPVEDSSVEWSEDRSPFVAVARITASPQPAWNEARARAIDDGMAFNPWHGLAAHQPLGSLNRLRKDSYAQSAAFRGRVNGCPMSEPNKMVDLSRQSAPTLDTRARGAAMPQRSTKPGTGMLSPIAAGAIGALAGGTLLSAMMLATEYKNKEPSDLVKLERRSADKLDQPHLTEPSTPTLNEQLASHGGHLALSAAAGAIYGAQKPQGVSPIVAGLTFGAAFYGLAYGVAGPALGLTPPLNLDKPASIAQHAAFHVLFGLTTAFVADRLTRKD